MKKFRAFRDAIQANMTKENQWTNGVMSGPPAHNGTEDVPMSEQKPLANKDADGNDVALKYSNTTVAANTTDVANTTAAANTTVAANATPAANATSLVHK